jgi:hypothetical protein
VTRAHAGGQPGITATDGVAEPQPSLVDELEHDRCRNALAMLAIRSSWRQARDVRRGGMLCGLWKRLWGSYFVLTLTRRA